MSLSRDAALPGNEAPRTWRHLTILDTIAEDADRAVYRAFDRARQGEVALKLRWTAAADAAHAVEDARLRMRARHPNLAPVFGAGEADGRVGFWTELVHGETLAELLETKGPFEPAAAARIGLALCGALDAVHEAGLYGDLCPHKIMRVVGDAGKDRFVLLDFATPPVLATSPSTLLFQPPEIFEGRHRTPAADIYALGVLLFHLVTNAYPVEGDSVEDLRRAHQAGMRKALKDLRPKLPQEFVHAVEHSLAPDPLDRYQTLGALEVTLTRYLGPHKKRFDWSNLPWMRVAAALAVLALGAAAGFGYRHVRLRTAAAATVADASAKAAAHAVPLARVRCANF